MPNTDNTYVFVSILITNSPISVPLLVTYVCCVFLYAFVGSNSAASDHCVISVVVCQLYNRLLVNQVKNFFYTVGLGSASTFLFMAV